MIIKPNDKKIRYTGRWNITEYFAASTANGNYFEFSYKGECAVLGFDTSYGRVPFPHIYISVDGGAKVEVAIDRFIRISAEEGEHRVCVILKSSVENQHRWYSPMEARTALLDIEADEFLTLPQDDRKTVEFIGDSITEGIAIDVGYENYKTKNDMVYWDDATAGYAWLTAKRLNLRPIIMGYGCLGTTQEGAGGIPPVAESYKYYSDGYPIESSNADFIVINHGTNDRRSDKELFKEKYFEFLCVVRQRNPKSKIISLTPFSGCLAKEIDIVVKKYNDEKNDNVLYIDTTGWVMPEPLHPTRDGHKTVSKKLSEIIKEKFL